MTALAWTQAVYGLSLLGWVTLLAGLLVLVVVQPARHGEVGQAQKIAATAVPLERRTPAQGRHRANDTNWAAPRLRTAPYVVNPPYISRVGTSEYPQITRRELVNAYQGGGR
jgi:hypothetical protein